MGWGLGEQQQAGGVLRVQAHIIANAFLLYSLHSYTRIFLLQVPYFMMHLGCLKNLALLSHPMMGTRYMRIFVYIC